MKERKIKQTIYKDPRWLFETSEFCFYLQSLEDQGRLSELPKNVYVYYVLSTLFEEVNNGGFSQFLLNSSRDLFYELSGCAEELHQEELTGLITEFVRDVTEFMDRNHQSIDELEPDEELEQKLDQLGERLYALEQQFPYDQMLMQYYKENLTVRRIVFNAVKEKPGKDCRYFLYRPDNDLDGAVCAFLDFLSDCGTGWRLEVTNYNIIAYPEKFCVVLSDVMSSFADDEAPLGLQSPHEHRAPRRKMCEFGFVKVSALQPQDGGDPDWFESLVVLVEPSEFEEDEYQIKQQFGVGFCGSDLSEDNCTYVIVGNFAGDGVGARSRKETLDALLANVGQYPAVASVFETHYAPGTLEKNEIFFYQR